ncbi:MAG: hypothetical protein J6B56_06370 [Clostridia bacterium]|nr:hypothetical protein [Clostridia bacterium]
MAKVFRTVALALAAIALAAAVAVAGSYALFTDTVTVSHHLQAGKLEAKLTRKTLLGNQIDASGYLCDYQGEKDVDFSGETKKNVFDLEDTLIVPCMYREATMELTNGGNVAFAYWIEIVLTAPTKPQDVALSEQLEVSVKTQNAGAGMSVTDQPIQNDGKKITIGSQENPVGVVELSTAQTFSVKVAFKDYGDKLDNANNNAKGGKLQFDMIVYAVQVVA